MSCFVTTHPVSDIDKLRRAISLLARVADKICTPSLIQWIFERDRRMARESRFSSNDPAQRLQALSRWDNEGGAIPVGPFVNPASGAEPIDIPELTNAELVALRIRVIALENLLISLLSTASDHQLEVAREMAGYISPRPGFTPHPLTIHAAAHMVDLVERSLRFRTKVP